MKKILYSLFTLGVLCMFSSCEETTQDTSKITYFVSLELEGSSIMAVPQGGTYTEPGYYAEQEGVDVTSQVNIIGTVDTDRIGIYNLTYWVANEDNMRTQLVRRVCVYDPTPSPMESGEYKVSPSSFRDNAGTIAAYGGNFSVIVYQVEPGVFYTTDFLGGWYDQRAGYGSDYALEGEFELNSDNTIKYLDSYLAGWGDEVEEMLDAVYDPDTKTINWNVVYAGGMEFIQTLIKE